MIFLFEAAPINPATGTTTTYRFCSGHATSAASLLDNKEWEPNIAIPPTKSATYFNNGQVDTVSIDYGSIGLSFNLDSPRESTLLAAISKLSWDGATGRAWVGVEGQPFTSYTKIFEGTMGPISRDVKSAKIPLYGLDFRLNETNILTGQYAGTGGAEGPAELKGQFKPRAFGACRYASPVRINTAYVIYQVNDGACSDISAVYENAYPLSAPIATVSTYAALAALTLPAGTWAKAPAVGMFRLGSEPYGKLTCDVQGNSSAGTTLGSISTYLLTQAGVSASDIDASVAAVGSQTWNLFVDSQTTVGEEIRTAYAKAFCYITSNSQGKMQAGSWLADGSTITIGGADSDFPAIPKSFRQEEASPPNYSVTINAERCWSPHSESEISPAIQELQAGQAALNVAATNAQNAANQAAADILVQKARTDSIVSDSVLDRSEKAQVKLQYAGIVGDYSKIISQAAGYSVSSSAYTTAYNALASYLGGLSPAWNDLTQDTVIVRTTWDSTWEAERAARTVVLQAIADATAKLANWPQVTGANRPADNATVGAIAGTNLKDSSGAVLSDNAIRNQAIVVDGNGNLTNIGSNGIQVDNTKQQWTSVLSRPTDLTSLNYGEGTKLATVQQNADKTSLNTAAYLANQSEWATTTMPIAGVSRPPNNLIYNSTGRLGLDRWTATPSTGAWTAALSYYGYQIGVNPTGAGTYTLLSDAFAIAGPNYYLSIDDLTYYEMPTFKLLAYDGNDNRVPADDIPITGLGGSNSFGRTGVAVNNYTGSRRYRFQITYVTTAVNRYWSFRNVKFEYNSVGTPWNDSSSNGAVYADFKAIDQLKPLEIGANVTETRTSQNFLGQGALATRDDVRTGLNLKDSSGAILTDNAIKNGSISIIGGAISGIGTGSGTIVSNNSITLNANGTISGAGGGAVTINGLGYTGALNATVNIVTSSSTAPSSPNNGDIWIDTSVTPNLTKVRVAGSWIVGANYVTNTNQVTDGAGLGNTAVWNSVASRPLNLGDLDGAANSKLGGIQAGATVGAVWGTNLSNQPTNLAAINSTEGTKLTGIQANADVTAQSQHSIVAAVPSIDFLADYTNTLLTGQLARTIAIKRLLGTTDVSTSATWSLSASSGISASVSTSGLVSFSAVATGQLVVSGLYNGVTQQVGISITRTQGAAPSGGGSGAATASTTSISAATSSSYVTGVSNTLTLSAGGSGIIDLTAGLDFYITTQTSYDQYQGCYGKWQWRVSGGTFADVAAETGATSTAFQPSFSSGGGGGISATIDADTQQAAPGRLDASASKSGLTSGSTYDFRFIWRLAGSGPSLSAGGTFYAAKR